MSTERILEAAISDALSTTSKDGVIRDHHGQVVGTVVWSGRGSLLPERPEHRSDAYTAPSTDTEIQKQARRRARAVAAKKGLLMRQTGKGRARIHRHYDLTRCACGCDAPISRPLSPSSVPKRPHIPRFVSPAHRKRWLECNQSAA